MDPFEQRVAEFLKERLDYAKSIYDKNKINNDEQPEDTRLPFDIAKTIQYLNQEAYLQKRKALKKQKEIV